MRSRWRYIRLVGSRWLLNNNNNSSKRSMSMNSNKKNTRRNNKNKNKKKRSNRSNIFRSNNIINQQKQKIIKKLYLQDNRHKITITITIVTKLLLVKSQNLISKQIVYIKIKLKIISSNKVINHYHKQKLTHNQKLTDLMLQQKHNLNLYINKINKNKKRLKYIKKINNHHWISKK